MNLRDIALGTVVYPLAAVRADESTTRDVQFRLLSWGYQPGPADGDWGSRTESAYIQFARDYDYSSSSMTPRTAAHLASLAFRGLQAIAQQPSTFTLFSLRDNPHIARDVQSRLTKLGYSPGPIDGLWGKSTQTAFTAFAQANQFPSDRISPQAAKKLLAETSAPTPGPAPAPVPTPAPAPAPTPTPVPVPPGNSVVVPTEPDRPERLRDIQLGSTTYPLSEIRSNVGVTRDIQFRLTSWGYQPGPVDGDWGGLTEQAFIAFARDYGYLNQSITPRAADHLASLAFRDLQQIAGQGSRFTIFSIKGNPLIAKDVQERLKKLNFYTSPIDGDWGSSTQTAYSKFAEQYDFPTDTLTPQAAAKLIALSDNPAQGDGNGSDGGVVSPPVPSPPAPPPHFHSVRPHPQ